MRPQVTIPGLILLIWSGALSAADDELRAPTVTTRELAELGDEISDWAELTDNVFLRAERRQQLLNSAQRMVGSSIHFEVQVRNVTHEEVLVYVRNDGRTWIALQHASPPEFGDLGTVQYCSTPSTRFARTTPPLVGLRIGSEIPLPIAKTLRHNDRLHMQGLVESIHVHLENFFFPRALTVVRHFHVTGVDKDGGS